MAKLETLLNEEIKDEFSEVSKLEVGSDKYKVAVDGLAKLCDRAIELEKIKSEQEFKREQHEVETRMKEEQMKEENKDRKIKNGLTAASIGVPAALAVWGTLKSIKFEETGTITTLMGRGWIQKLLPKK